MRPPSGLFMATISNPTRPRALKPIHLISDRAKRYRANRTPPPGPKQCAYCGSKRNVEIEHIDGNEANAAPENLTWACRSCNVKKGVNFAKRGRGVRTVQFNPGKVIAGAKSLGQWLTAVMVTKGESDAMSLSDAVAIIRATPHSRRSEFADAIWQRRKERGTDRSVPF